AGIRPENKISIALNTMLNMMKNDAAVDSTRIDQDSIWIQQDTSWTEPDSVLYVGQIHNVNSSYSANIMYQFMMFNMNQSLNANFSMQLSEDKNPARLGNDINTRNIMFAFMSMLSRSWSATANVSLNTVDLESQDKTSRTGLGLTITNRILAGKLSNTIGANMTNSDQADVTGITFQSNYSITRADVIRLSAKTSMYKNNDPATIDYNEYIASLSYSHRF
ncbi:MAG: hypothetical protein GY839_10935, partial [candidate division Zixibacteria bacterium]|nr:hypothetical protein [candidate division Zixibacteria bacterium]